MSATHMLHSVRPTALALVRKGANRQVFFSLRKAEGDEQTVTLPAPHELLKAADDWSVAMCVVASPDAEENGGQLNPEITDRWRSEQDIADAARSFLKERAFISKAHGELAAEGCHLVESAIALDDFQVDGTTISKGSWYVGLELDEDARGRVENGDFSGVSLEGTGMRDPIEKASHAPSAQGTKGKDREGKGTSQTCPKCGGKAGKGVKKCPNCGKALTGSTGMKTTAVKKDSGMTSRALAAIGKALGIDPTTFEEEGEEEDLVKAAAVSTFSRRMAAREIEDDLPMALDELRGAVYDSIYPFAYGYVDPPSPADARGALDASLGQFHEYLIGVFDRIVGGQIEKSDELRAMLGTLGENLPSGDTTTEDDDEMAEKTRIEKLEEDMAKVTTAVESLVTGLKPVIEKAAEEATPTIEDVQKQMGELAAGIQTVAKSVERLGQGGSAQNGEVQKSTSTDPLAGILS